METLNIETSLSAIRTALRTYHTPQITGAQVNALIQSIAPEINVREIVGKPNGPGALTLFVHSYLSNVLERTGQHGGDVLYDIRHHLGKPDESPETVNIWRAFVSPASPNRITFDQGKGLLSLRETFEVIGQHEVEIGKVTADEHNAMRSEFSSTLTSGEEKAFQEAVAENMDFEAWISALRSKTPTIYRQWGIYRKQKLLNLFIQRINGLQTSEPVKQRLIEQIKAAHFSAYEKRKGLKPAPSEQVSPPPTTKTDYKGRLTEARVLVHRLVEFMEYEELRAIKLPLGAVLDAFPNRDQ